MLEAYFVKPQTVDRIRASWIGPEVAADRRDHRREAAVGHITQSGTELRQRARADRPRAARLVHACVGHDQLIERGAPWQNPFAESFNARVRDELLNLEEFSRLAEAQVLAEDWRSGYNREHPHSALGYRSPDAFATAWSAPAT